MIKPKKKPEQSENETQEQVQQEQQEQQEQEQNEYINIEESKKEDKSEYYINIAKQIQADFDNFRKRNASIYSSALAEGKADAVKAFLTVIDNLDRALLAEQNKETSLYTGIQLTRTQFDEALTSLGVEQIGKTGEAFDPQFHNAVMQAPAEGEQKPGEIAEVFLKGYKLGDRVIRHTVVKVTV